MSNRSLRAAIPALVWLAIFLLLPVVVLLTAQVEASDISRVLTRQSTWRIAWFSLWQALASVIATFALALPLTWFIGRHQFRGRGVVRAFASVGFFLPSVVVAAGFIALLPTRLHVSLAAMIAAHAYFNIAVVLRVIAPRLETFDIGLLAAARTLGAGALRTFTSVAWPAMRTAVVSAAGVVFIYCFTSYAVVRTLGGVTRNTIESDIAVRAYAIGDLGGAVVLSLVQVVVIATVVLLGRALARDAATAPRRTTLTLTAAAGVRAIVGAVIIVATLTVVAAPLIALAISSLQVGDTWSFAGWRSLIDNGAVAATPESAPAAATSAFALVDSLVTSGRTAVLAAIVALVLATGLARTVVRLGTRGRWLDAVSMVPLIVSPVTLGLGLVVTFDSGWYDWRGTWWFVAVVHSVVGLPLAVRVLVPVWRNVAPSLRDAAAVLGATPRQRFIDIDLRLLRPALVAAAGLVAAVSLGEFGAASMLSRSGAETLPVMIARLLGRTGDLVRTQAFVLATVLVVACVSALLLVESGARNHSHPRDNTHA
ncbi:MAG: iron ABC transporter permease [Actinobacteria bacterium]|nr:iron ABC transporter permease [Actinomycetota bacterium]